jgi:hypothetical protein
VYFGVSNWYAQPHSEDAFLRRAFDDLGSFMCPFIPREIPVYEILGSLALILLAVSAALASRSRKSAILLGTISFLTLIVATATMAARNFGQWGELKNELISYELAVRRYEAVRGHVDTDDEAKALRKQLGRRSYAFSPGCEVDIEYLWWHDPGRVGIVWGKGGTAVFDLRTMIHVYGD